MPRRTKVADDWDDDYGRDDDEPTLECPYCRKEIHEESERCPYCENYISAEDMPAGGKPWWILLGAILGLIVAYKWIVGW